jgi:tetratricopeptide (TPR) repeat protein
LAAYRRATDLTVDEQERAEILALAGRAAVLAGLPVAAGLLERAIELHQAAGRTDAAVAAILYLARALNNANRMSQAIDLLEQTLVAHDHGEPDEHAARLAALLALTLRFVGRTADIVRPLEVALIYAQALELPDVVATALFARANLMGDSSRFIEAEFDFNAVQSLAERNDLTVSLAAGSSGLANLRIMADMPEPREPAERAVALFRRIGNRQMEMISVGNLALLEIMAGRWQRGEQLATEALERETAPVQDLMHERLALLYSLRGDLESAAAHADACKPMLEGDDLEARAMANAALATVALAGGDFESAVSRAVAALQQSRTQGLASEGARQAWPDAMEAAIALGDLPRAEELLTYVADVPPGRVPLYLRAQHLRCRALLADARGDATTAESDLRGALDAFRKLEYPFWIARTLLELSTLLHRTDRAPERAPLLEEAGATFASLGARPWLERVRHLASTQAQDSIPSRQR